MAQLDYSQVEGLDLETLTAAAGGVGFHLARKDGRTVMVVQGCDQAALAAALAAYADPPEWLEVRRAQALEEIDRRAGQERAQYLTDIPGQAMIYEAKRREAEAWTADGEPTDSKDVDFPIAAAEASACGRTLAEQLKVYAAEAAAWQVLAGTMEAVRMAAKQAALAAATTAEIQAILDGLSWPKA